ncbi:hypothetical protein BLNAU_6132 [Blattamonas nauphoetae]|uniref:Uncharacterized protein n=1 Tax=Blattamonas nauphoetae TaxID=2049346 RepID=A0ABQ9Y5A9_9EUKA|nr:hypothetical protein BLNAU_6132 [Blattamonas nauphoetae]
MTQTHFCGLCSDVGNVLIAGADEQILGSPPIVQKWFSLLGSSFSTRLSLTVTSSTVLSPSKSWRPCILRFDKIIFPILDIRTVSKQYLVYLVKFGWAPHSRHSTAIHDMFEQTKRILVLIVWIG